MSPGPALTGGCQRERLRLSDSDCFVLQVGCRDEPSDSMRLAKVCGDSMIPPIELANDSETLWSQAILGLGGGGGGEVKYKRNSDSGKKFNYLTATN